MNEKLQPHLQPIIDFLATLDPSDPEAATKLNEKFPLKSDSMVALAGAFEQGVKEGWLCDRQAGEGVSYSRVGKDLGPTRLSIDAVRMDRPGPGHIHPNGEFDLCFAVSGEPKFDDKEPGWVVYGPQSWHIPSVSGGTMNILYFLPGGAIEFGTKPQ